MDKISVNKLVEEVKSNLPREILVLIAQNCLNKNTDIQTTIKNFENEVYKYTLKVQKKLSTVLGHCYIQTLEEHKLILTLMEKVQMSNTIFLITEEVKEMNS